jgi:predicted alpha/beta hydrolase
MGVPARYYDHFAASLAARGIACQTSELRGVETSSLRARRSVDFGYRELVEFDLACAVVSVRARFPDLPLYLVGHSLGGQIGVLFSAMHADQVKGIALIAAATPYYRMFPGRRRAVMLGGSVVFPLVSRALGYWPGRLFRFGRRESRRLIAEWGHLGRT